MQPLVAPKNPLNFTISSGHTPLNPYVKSNPTLNTPPNLTENLGVFLVKLTGVDCTCIEGSMINTSHHQSLIILQTNVLFKVPDICSTLCLSASITSLSIICFLQFKWACYISFIDGDTDSLQQTDSKRYIIYSSLLLKPIFYDSLFHLSCLYQIKYSTQTLFCLHGPFRSILRCFGACWSFTHFQRRFMSRRFTSKFRD